MSKVKIKGNASGTGVLTIEAPNTNTDRTITLPDEDITLGGGVDGIVSTADATAITIDSSENVGIGTTTPASRLHLKDSYLALTLERSASPTSTWDIKPYANDLTFRDGTQTDRLTLKSDGRGLSQFTAKAWVNFNGTGTVAIRDSHNISSITDLSTGNYTVNFTNTMANGNYVASVSSDQTGGVTATTCTAGSYTTSSHDIAVRKDGTSTDPDTATSIIFGD